MVQNEHFQALVNEKFIALKHIFKRSTNPTLFRPGRCRQLDVPGSLLRSDTQ